MRSSKAKSQTSPPMWFAVAGAPVAWGLQFTIGYWLTQAHCSVAGGAWGIPLDVAVVILTVAAAAAALGAGVAALRLFRATRDAELHGAPPAGRVHFLATVGMAVTPLFVCIIVMNGVGILILGCNQA